MWLISFLVGSRVGRIIALSLLAGVVVGLVMLSFRRNILKAEQLKRQIEKLNSIRERIKVDEKIRTMPLADRRDALNRWVRQAR